jgi:muramoyltetrapeptide carboxypeptidase
MPLRPPRLEPGDTIGLIAPAGPVRSPDAIHRAIARLEQLGFRLHTASHLFQSRGYLAGSDRQRLADLHRLFQNPRIKAILCARGGYGSTRLIPHLNLNLIRNHPKIFVGYSDVTALHAAIHTLTGLITFHGPMAGPDLGRPDLPEFTLRSLLHTLTQPHPPGSILDPATRPLVRILRKGRATGPLLPANLSMLVATLATPYQPDFHNRILCLEEVAEPPYRIDRMLTQLLHSGLLDQIAGIAIGRCERCTDPPTAEPDPHGTETLRVWEERLRPLRKPILFGLPFGHTALNATLPWGVRAELDAVRGDLHLLEPAVR